MDDTPLTQDTTTGPEVVGIDNEHGADIYSEPLPTTSFDEIVTRGGNNPDGTFLSPSTSHSLD